MSIVSYAIVFVGLILEACLLWRLLLNGEWRTYPYFSLYIVCVIAQTLSLYPVYAFIHSFYRSFYWNSEAVTMAFRFLVVWEVFRHTFPPGSAINKSCIKGVCHRCRWIGHIFGGNALEY